VWWVFGDVDTDWVASQAAGFFNRVLDFFFAWAGQYLLFVGIIVGFYLLISVVKFLVRVFGS